MNSSRQNGGLLDLDKLILTEAQEALLAAAANHCAGPASWRQRKLAEYRSLLKLSLLSRRFQILATDLEFDLRIVIALRTPVPCSPDDRGQLRTTDGAVVGLRYPEEAVRRAQPGSAFVHILQPRGIFHSNVAVGTQQLCLGAKLPAGIRLHELVLLTFGALSLQNVTLDVLDSAGVLNPTAASFFHENTRYVPLTREPFVLEDRP